MEIKLTETGRAVMLRAAIGNVQKINFTYLQLGNGLNAGEKPVALSNPLMHVDFTAIKMEAGFATLSCVLTNSTVSSSFRITEMGIWITDPDSPQREILYAYGYAPEGDADYVPKATSGILETQLDILVYVGTAKNVSASISASLVYVGKEEFDAHKNARNPHGTTAADIGLGNVENKKIEDQTPAFTQARNQANITSGDTVRTILGKAAKAITDLYHHLSKAGNPHNTKPEDIGAAPASHTHDVADFNRGTLAVSRGGTGLTMVPTDYVLVGTEKGGMRALSPHNFGKLLGAITEYPKWHFLSTQTISGNKAAISIDIPAGYIKYRITMDLVSVSGQYANLEIRFDGGGESTLITKDKAVHKQVGDDFIILIEPVPGTTPNIQLINKDDTFPPIYGLAGGGSNRNANWNVALSHVTLRATGTSFKSGSKIEVRGFK